MTGILNLLAGAVSSVIKDTYFNLTTLLLPGDGTNGAQNNTFLDSSSNNFTITRNGNTTQGTFSPFSQTGWSVFNPDSDNGLGVAANSALDMGTGDFTIEAWINTAKLPTTNAFQTSSGGFQAVFGTGPNLASSGSQLYIGVTNLKFDIATDGGGPIDVAHNMVAGQWYHIAITREGTTFRAFINGSLVQTATSSTSWTGGYAWGIMRAEPIGGYGGAWWYGYVSNFRAVKGRAVYTSAFTPSTSPLGATSGGQSPPTGTQTSLLICQSNRYVDNGGLTTPNTVTINGTPSVQSFSPFAPTAAYSAATVGGSGYFDGTGDYLSVATNAALTVTGNVDACFEAWIYPTVTPGASSCVFQKSGTFGSVYSNYELAFSTGRAVILFGGNSGSPGSAVFTLTGATGMPLNAWSHIVGTKRYVGGGSVNEYRVFVNGKLDGYVTAANISDGNAQAFTVGSQGGTAFTGYIAGVRVFNTAIPSDYQTTNTTVGTQIFTPPTAPATAGTSSILLNYTNAGITDATAKNDLETVGNAQISTTQSKFGGSSLYFDGTGDGLYFPTNIPFISSGDFTVEGWFYTGSSSNQTLISLNSSASTGYAAMRIDFEGSTGKLFLLCSANNSSWGVNVGTTNTISLNTWAYFAVVRSGSSFTVYINGTSGATATLSGVLYAGTASYVGCHFSTSVLAQPVNGYLDDIRVTRYARTITASPTAAFPLQ